MSELNLSVKHHLTLDEALHSGTRACKQIHEFRDHFLERLAERIGLAVPDQPLG